MAAIAYIALGSNLGDRRLYLDRALQALRKRPGVTVHRISSFYETVPVGGPPNQGLFLNAAAEVKTDLDPRALLRALLEVEQALGRVRREKDGPRIIDLDLLLYGDARITEGNLILPHPRMHERRFVLEPLAEIAPLAVHPVLKTTIRDLLAKLPGSPRTIARDLVGMKAVVTGSTSGIGRAIALELARAGADIVIHGRRPGPKAAEVAAQAQAAGVRPHVLHADLSDPEQCRSLAKQAWDTCGSIDIWINNAGADTLTGPAAKWPFERKLAELLAVDVAATILLSRELGQRMKERGRGILLNMGWDQAETGMEGDSGELFATAKGAVMAFSRSLALSLAPQVRVNCLAPGWIRTAWGEQAPLGWQERARRETPLDRWGLPEDVAAAAHWLVSPAAGFLTGQIVRVDGGSVR